MATPQLEAPYSPFAVDDLIAAVFKHKWKILLCITAGLIAAGWVYFFAPPVYESRAKLLVRYVVERSTIDPIENTASSSGGYKSNDSVIGSEVEILTSWDLAVQVAEALGANRVLPAAGPAATTPAAASAIRDGLSASFRTGTNIIFVSFRNSNREVAHLVLEELVNRYFTKHLEVHRSAGAFDFVAQQTDQVRSRLNQAEDALKALKAKLGIISLQGSFNALGGELNRIQEQIYTAEAEIMDQQTRIKLVEGTSAQAGASATPAPPKDEPTSGIIQHYQALVGRLASLRGAELELLSKYTPGNVYVKLTQTQIGDLETQRQDLEKRFPGLVNSPQQPASLGVEKGRLAGMEIRLEMLKNRRRNVME